MKKAIAHIEMDNGDEHEITEKEVGDSEHCLTAREILNDKLETAGSFLVADDGTVIIVSRIHTITVTEE